MADDEHERTAGCQMANYLFVLDLLVFYIVYMPKIMKAGW